MKKEQCPVPIWQDPEELKDLVKEVKRIKPKNILEIGSLNGGTLWTWIHEFKPRKLCSIDLPIDRGDFRYADQHSGHNGVWGIWCREINCELNVIPGRSDEPSAYTDVLSLSKTYDFIFVDGGHTYSEVRGDYIRFFPLLRKGGIMAFHDINEAECPDVVSFWDEIRINHRYKEFKYLENKWGIGVIYAD